MAAALSHVRALLELCPGHAALVRGDGALLAGNRSLNALLERLAIGPDAPLTEAFASAPDALADILRRAFGSGRPVIGALMVRSATGAAERPRVQALCIDRREGPATAWHVLWLTPSNAGAQRFQDLNATVVQLRNEIVRRRAVEETLERRVLERTQEIEAVNGELHAALEKLQSAQSEIVQSAKMAALGALVAGVAHELNTPIGNGVTMASVLQVRTDDLHAAVEAGSLRRSELESYAEDMRSGADILLRNLSRAAELIASFKQVATDRTSASRRVFDLREMIDDQLVMLQPLLQSAAIAMEVQVEKGVILDSYPGALGQVIANLIVNATQHAFEGRDQRAIAISAREVQGAIEMQVSDNGIGILELDRPRIFDPFYTTKVGKGGTGLGLNIAYNLATNVLGGRITLAAKDASRAGATFQIILAKHAPRPDLEST